ncbi:hypothetical protein AG1IA_04415 [Rhizoctonia solani AG-1 IA]|uniref:Uncharacterized protein n=1 Tax=Thanatephorus cucumeris (strain AG1-IA) TaxID=983506 RepID=L8WU81_THACA|nr:hypothetical protein AG1IA_04415 [Rhizoctonia solani AG-1 IA]
MAEDPSSPRLRLGSLSPGPGGHGHPQGHWGNGQELPQLVLNGQAGGRRMPGMSSFASAMSPTASDSMRGSMSPGSPYDSVALSPPPGVRNGPPGMYNHLVCFLVHPNRSSANAVFDSPRCLTTMGDNLKRYPPSLNSSLLRTPTVPRSFLHALGSTRYLTLVTPLISSSGRGIVKEQQGPRRVRWKKGIEKKERLSVCDRLDVYLVDSFAAQTTAKTLQAGCVPGSIRIRITVFRKKGTYQDHRSKRIDNTGNTHDPKYQTQKQANKNDDQIHCVQGGRSLVTIYNSKGREFHLRLFLTKGESWFWADPPFWRFQSVDPTSTTKSLMLSEHQNHRAKDASVNSISSAGTRTFRRWAWHLFLLQHPEARWSTGGGHVGDMYACERGWWVMVY